MNETNINNTTKDFLSVSKYSFKLHLRLLSHDVSTILEKKTVQCVFLYSKKIHFHKKN